MYVYTIICFAPFKNNLAINMYLTILLLKQTSVRKLSTDKLLSPTILATPFVIGKDSNSQL